MQLDLEGGNPQGLSFTPTQCRMNRAADCWSSISHMGTCCLLIAATRPILAYTRRRVYKERGLSVLDYTLSVFLDLIASSLDVRVAVIPFPVGCYTLSPELKRDGYVEFVKTFRHYSTNLAMGSGLEPT